MAIIPLDQVLHDTTTLKQAESLTIVKGIGHGRDSAIRVDIEEPLLLLGVARNIDIMDFVWEPNLSNKQMGMIR